MEDNRTTEMEDNRTTVVFNRRRTLSKCGQRSQDILLRASLKNKSLSVTVLDSKKGLSVDEKRSVRLSISNPGVLGTQTSKSEEEFLHSLCMSDSMSSTSSLECSKPSVSRTSSQNSSIDDKAKVLKANLDQMQKLTFEMDLVSSDLKNIHCSFNIDGKVLNKLDDLNNLAQTNIQHSTSNIRHASQAYQEYLEILQNFQESATCETRDEETKTEIIFHKVPIEAVERMRRLTNELNQFR